MARRHLGARPAAPRLAVVSLPRIKKHNPLVVDHKTYRIGNPNEALQVLLLVDYLTHRVDDAAQRIGATLP